MYARLRVSFCCTKSLIAQKFQSLSAIMASECVSSNKRFGVYKFDHLADVQVEDLHKFGNFKLVLYVISTLMFKFGELYFSLLYN